MRKALELEVAAALVALRESRAKLEAALADPDHADNLLGLIVQTARKTAEYETLKRVLSGRHRWVAGPLR